jgi:hypothetical protein
VGFGRLLAAIDFYVGHQRDRHRWGSTTFLQSCESNIFPRTVMPPAQTPRFLLQKPADD